MQRYICNGLPQLQVLMFVPSMRTAGLLLAQLGELVALAQQECGYTPSTVADQGCVVFGLPLCVSRAQLFGALVLC